MNQTKTSSRLTWLAMKGFLENIRSRPTAIKEYILEPFERRKHVFVDLCPSDLPILAIEEVIEKRAVDGHPFFWSSEIDGNEVFGNKPPEFVWKVHSRGHRRHVSVDEGGNNPGAPFPFKAPFEAVQPNR